MKLNKMMIAGTIIAASATSIFAANSTATTNTSTTNISKSWYQKLKDSPLSLAYIHEVSAVRNPSDKETFHGSNNMSYVSMSYKMTDKDKLNLFSRWDRRDIEDTNSDDDWTYAGIQYYRSGILTQDKHGVNMTFQLRQRFYPNFMEKSNRKEAVGASKRYWGYTRPGVILSRSLTDKLYMSWGTHVAFYNRYSGVEGQNSNYFYTYPSFSYSITDKFSTGLTVEYFKLHKKGGSLAADATTRTSEDLSATVEFGYALHPQISLGVSSGLVLMESHNGRTWNRDMDENFSLAASASISVF